jgi:hypothetical protein
MATTSDSLRPVADGTRREGGNGSLRHLFGPAVLVAIICLVVITATFHFWKLPAPYESPHFVKNAAFNFKELFEYQFKSYTAELSRLDANLSAQALVVATAILVIIRRSDSLNFFGNSIPLSWLHFFIPILLVYLFMAFGYISNDLIWGRMRGVEITNAYPQLGSEYKNLFRDAGWIDAWLVSFVDSVTHNYSGIKLEDTSFSKKTLSIVLVAVLGTLISAAHATTLAMTSIGCRRYLATRQKRRLLGYYLLPLVPLAFIVFSHVLFAYGGQHRNWFQLYVAVVSIVLMAALLWLSSKIDKGSYPETLQCLRRLRQVTLSAPIERLPLSRDRSESAADAQERTIALIGDSLSMQFHLSSLPQMLVRMRRGWKTNWFLTLPVEDQVNRSVLMRLSDLGTVTGVQHASVSAFVDSAKRRSALNYLTGTYHLSHQVDEVLTGPFPNILLLWIGHNDVDWRWQIDSQIDSLTQEAALQLSDAFVRRYETQLRRLLNGAQASETRSVIVVFGLGNIGSFFQARDEAEAIRRTDESLFPHLETAYRYFVSMRPEHRSGMIELVALFNDKLELMCKRLGEQLSGSKVRLVYSNAMSFTKMDSANVLSSDGWHASIYGHSMLADSAYPIVFEQAQFLGWVATNVSGQQA